MDNYNLELDLIFHALADPTRRAVVQRLGQGSASMSELAQGFDMALPSFMKHVRVLERTGVVCSSKKGRIRTCTLQPKRLASAVSWFTEQRAMWASRYGQLDQLLETLAGEPHAS